MGEDKQPNCSHLHCFPEQIDISWIGNRQNALQIFLPPSLGICHKSWVQVHLWQLGLYSRLRRAWTNLGSVRRCWGLPLLSKKHFPQQLPRHAAVPLHIGGEFLPGHLSLTWASNWHLWHLWLHLLRSVPDTQ